MWCVPELNEEYISRMEDILDLYEKPYDPEEPVVCLDERSLQLLDEVREFIHASPGKPARRDNEYRRCGTANIFQIVEPLPGRHFTYATHNRKAPEYAKALKKLADAYPYARTIHLVQDNLNTHFLKSLTNFYGEEKGLELWLRFTIHYTPKHGSWLNQAEIEGSLHSRQCIGRNRIPDFDTLDRKTRAWKNNANRKKIKINWKFTTSKAREKFGYAA